MSFGIDINSGIALRSYFLKVSGAKNIAQLLIRDPVSLTFVKESLLTHLEHAQFNIFFF